MALPSLAALTTPLTTAEVKASIYDILERLGVPTTSWKNVAVARAIIAAVSVVLAAFTVLMAEIAKSGFLELAQGDWLTLTAKYVYGVDRIEATFATGEVTVNNTAGGVFSFDPGDVVFSKTGSAKTYTNTDAFTLAALQTGVVVEIQALEQGADSTAPPNTITSLETTLLGVTVSNAVSVVGLDAENDAALRLRCYEKLSSLSPNGPRGAYAFFAKGATREDGSTIGVTRVRVTPDSDEGIVTVTVATATGAITGDVDDEGTDLGAVNLAIQTNVVPDGVTATIQSATALAIPVTYEIWIYTAASLTALELEELIETRLTEFMAGQPVAGNAIPPAVTGKVFHSAIVAAIGSVRDEIFQVQVTAPAGDVTVGATQVPVLGTVTPTAIHLVSA